MNIIISGATGFIGRNLIPVLLNKGFKVTAISRDKHKLSATYNQTIEAASWDDLEKLNPDNFDVIINLVGENISEKRWSETQKQIIKDSRVKYTNKLANWCLKGKNKSIRFLSASAVGFYGLQEFDEALPAKLTEKYIPQKDKYTDFLSYIARSWEEATKIATSAGFSVTLLRFGVVLKRNEGMLKKLETPYSLSLGGKLGSGNQPISWVHIDDLVNAILFIMDNEEVTGPVNIVSPNCVSQKNFGKTLANILQKPFFMFTPAFVVKLIFGEMGKELLLNGQNVFPERLLELGYKFSYSNLQSALEHEFNKDTAT